jgi:transcriptional regulator with XRE-family HTH domain
MTDHEKKRAGASDALIALRKAMGKTQQTFAVEVLKSSIGTVARYETADPPQGDVLLRLRDIAREHGFHEIASRFELAYREQMQKPLLSELTTVPATEISPAHGHLTISLPHERAIAAAQDFMILLAQLDSPDSKIKRGAVSAFSSLRKAARRYENPAVGEMQDTFLSAMSGEPPPFAPKSKRPKRTR